MTRRARQNHGPAVKACVALGAIEGERTLSGVGPVWVRQLDVHPSLITQGRTQRLEGACGVFGAAPAAAAAPAADLMVVHAKVGELALGSGSSSGALGKAGLLAGARR